MSVEVIQGDALACLRKLPDESVNCCVTSPPYWGLRDYGVTGQLGLERTPEEYAAHLVGVFREVRRVLRADGTLWLNLGDSYARNGGEPGGGNRESLHLEGKQRRMGAIPAGSGLKPKDLVGIPWRVAFALQADGWYLRSDIIWHKPNPMPESVTDRPTKAHEYLFLLSRSKSYYYDAAAIAERVAVSQIGRIRSDPVGGASRAERGQHSVGGIYRTGDGGAPCNKPGQEYRNKRSVWTIPTDPFLDAHFATFPPDLVRPCILAGCQQGDTVLDCFAGVGTTGLVAQALGCESILIELNPEYCAMIEQRCAQEVLAFAADSCPLKAEGSL